MKNSFKKLFSTKVSVLTEKNIVSSMKELANQLPFRDSLLSVSQGIKWTVKELNTYSDAFARHLLEVGLEPGQKFLIWSDVNHSAEIVCATLGAIKAGLTIVHSEYENSEDINKLLKSKEISAFMFSPYNYVESSTRLSLVENNLSNVQHVIQISHKSIVNTVKFKQAFNFSSGFKTNINLPEIKENSNVFEIFRSSSDKNERINLNHGSLMDKLRNTNLNQEYINVVNTAPIFYPANFVLGFLRNLISKNFVVLPATYSLKEILKIVESQNAKKIICEGNLLDLQLDKKLFENKFNSIEEITVIGENLKDKNSSNFSSYFPNAKIEFFDEFTFNKI